MKLRFILSDVSRHVNTTNDLTFPKNFPYINELFKLKIVTSPKLGLYILNFPQYVSYILAELGVKNPNLHKCGEILLYHLKDLANGTSIGFYFAEPYLNNMSDLGFFIKSLQECITVCMQNKSALVPLVFIPENLRKLLEKHDRAIHLLSKFYLTNLNILSFPIIMPYPEIIITSDKHRKLDLFIKLNKYIKEIEKILKELDDTSIDEYVLALKYRRLFWSKFLISFVQLDSILKRYALMRIRKKWKGPSKWFEEIIKLLLIDVFVRNKFDKEVENFIINYKTGGRKADIIIPIMKDDNEIILWIIDTKHWEQDFCRSIENGFEKPEKYVAYVDKNNRKSRAVWKLVKLLENKNPTKIKFHLIFIQRKNRSCILDIPKLKEYYENIVVLGLNNINSLLQL